MRPSIAALAVAAAMALSPAVAGAAPWAPPDGYTDLLAEPYGPTHSIHVTCAPDGSGLEVGVHTADDVARSFQVLLDGTFLVNVQAADHVATVPFGVEVRYSGDTYPLVPEDAQRALCQPASPKPEPAPEPEPEPDLPPAETPPAIDVQVLDAPPVVRVDAGPPPYRAALPDTGRNTGLLAALGVAAVALGSLLVLPGQRREH